MRGRAYTLTRAIREAAQQHTEMHGTGRYRAVVKRWAGPSSFSLDLVGVDLQVDDGDVTASQAVRAYDQDLGVQVDDVLVLVETDPGEYTAVAVESDTTVPAAADAAAIQAALDDAQDRLDALEAAVAAEYETAISLGGGWSATSGRTPVFSKVGRLVVLGGQASKTGGTPTSGDVIATLPTRARPTFTLNPPVVTQNGDVVGTILVQINGQIIWRTGSTAETDGTCLDGISFVVAA